MKTDPNYGLWKGQLGIFIDTEGLLRCRGRLQNTDLPFSTQFPLILPRESHFTMLIVRQAHEQVYHNGVKDTLAQVRSKYWIIRGRSLVKRLIGQCVICRRLEGLSYIAPPPPPLPPYRVREAPPFDCSGVDYAGPLFVRMEKSANCTTKVWISLITCCVTRAIHLDLVFDMTSQLFIRCFKRFVARRGLPHRMVSDNGKTFKGAAKFLRRIAKQPEVQRYLDKFSVQWTFNVERAPWWGGLFERLVRSTKRCLKKMVGRAKLTYEELLTVLSEIEMVINSRPLSYVSPDDLEEPLTPSHLLIGRRLMNLPDNLLYDERMEDEDYSITPEVLTKRMRFLHRTIHKFWSRWKREYLLELRNSHNLTKRDQSGRKISVGDVVVIHDDNQPRGLWRLGLVLELIVGRDGYVRGAKVRVSAGERTSVWQRPIQRLYPIEVNCYVEKKNVESSSQDSDQERDDNEQQGGEQLLANHLPRPRRTAAIEALNRIAV